MQIRKTMAEYGIAAWVGIWFIGFRTMYKDDPSWLDYTVIMFLLIGPVVLAAVEFALILGGYILNRVRAARSGVE